MANLTTSGTTGYPGVIDTRTALTDGATGDLIVANHPNGLGAAVLAIEGALGLTPQGTAADVVTRLNISQNADGTIKSSVITAGAGAAVAYSSGVFTVAFSGDGPGFLQNMGLRVDTNAPVANQMRINLLQADLSTPTSTLPVRIAFRAATTTGTYNLRTATTSTTLVVSGGSTLGFLPGETGRIYIGVVDNNSVPELCVWNPKTMIASTTAIKLGNLFRPSEAEFQTTTAEGGAGAADTAGTLFSTTARTTVPFRMIAYLDITTGATAGNWSNTPNLIQLIGPGTRTTGDIIQVVATTTQQVRTGTVTVPLDDTIPQISEGNLFMWASITSANPVNPLVIDHIGEYSNTAPARMIVHAHRNSEANALGVGSISQGVAVAADQVVLKLVLATNTSGASGFYIFAGNNGAGTTTFNGESAAGLFQGSYMSYLTLTEVCA